MSPFGALLLAAAVLPASLIDPRTEAETTLLPGRTTHLGFFATWCAECVEELPALAELRDRSEPRGHRIVVVAVRTRQDSARLRAFAEGHSVPGTLLWDRDGALAASLGAAPLPAHILLGTDGSEIGRWGRLEEGIEDALRARLRRLEPALLATIVMDAEAAKQSPKQGRRRLKVFRATQTAVNPPTFSFLVNDAKLVHFSYQRFLEYKMRQYCGFKGTPLRLVFKCTGDKKRGEEQVL